jgi:sulfotransferase
MDLEPKKNQNKQLFFLVALPRSGNTLFTSIINQNPEIVCTPNSITLEIMKDLFLLKQTDVFLNYQDHDSLDNVLDSVFDNYYKDWPQQYIIDRGPVMTPGNLMLMQKHYRRPFKCIVILRDLMDVLASYMKWYKNNPDAFPNRYNLNSDDEKLGMIMNKDGAVAKDLEAIKNAFNYPDICHFVKYDDLISKPEQEMRKIYQFIGLPYYNHQFENLQQINVNGIGYDDKVVGKNMHTIRNVVRKEINPYLDQIPERIRQKYGHIRF